MTCPKSELLGLSQSLRQLVEWDAEDEAVGYPYYIPALAEPAAAAPPAVAAPSPPPPAQPVQGVETPPSRQSQPTLDALRAELGDCRRCKLCEGRSTIVFGEGSPQADLMFVGEGPGYHEDRTGRPFVGKAGELLERMIQAMGLSRSSVYICNVVKCRPPENRDPHPDEIIACQPFLHAQVRSIRPQVIVALGRFASQCLTGSSEAMWRLRGRFHLAMGIPLCATYHPAYLLRNPSDKRKAWEDLQMVMAKMGLERPR